MIKRLESSKQKEKADIKRKEKESEIKAMQDEMDQLKKQRIEEINRQYEDKKKQSQVVKDQQIQEKS